MVYRSSCIAIRPFRESDLPYAQGWKRFSEWPKEADSGFSSLTDYRSIADASSAGKEILLIAEKPENIPIGIAHFSVTGLPKGIAQYSIAMPDPNERSIGRGKEFLLLSLGAAFYIYRFRDVFSLISPAKGWLVAMCLKGGCIEEPDFSFLGISSKPAQERILRLGSAEWTALWGHELLHSASRSPWLRRKLDWRLLAARLDRGNSVKLTNHYPAFEQDKREGAALQLNDGIDDDLRRTAPPKKVLL